MEKKGTKATHTVYILLHYWGTLDTACLSAYRPSDQTAVWTLVVSGRCLWSYSKLSHCFAKTSFLRWTQ